MKAMLLGPKGEFIWSDVPNPVCAPGTVVIKVKAAGLNRADLLQRAGNYPPPPGWPEWPGLEISGTISESAPGSKWKFGEEVCALLGGGGYAEYAVVPEGMVMHTPKNIDLLTAAALPEVFATCFLNLKFEGKLQPGETFFMPAAASGLGTIAVQMAKAMGAKVIGSAGSPEKAALIKQLGADIAIDRKNQSIKDVLLDNPPDLVMDCIAGDTMAQLLPTLKRGGRWIIIATLGGDFANLSMRDVMKGAYRIIGSTLRSRTNEMKAQILSELECDIWPMVENGRIKPIIHTVMPLTEVEKAHQILADARNAGKVILQVC